MISNILIGLRVNRGVALLNAKNPGWYDKINSDNLNIAHSEQCVLGQLYGHFSAGVSELMINPKSYGFVVPMYTRRFLHSEYYQRLTAFWKQAILAKKQAQFANDTLQTQGVFSCEKFSYPVL